MTRRPGMARESIYTNVNLGMVPRLPVSPGGGIGTPTILGADSTLQLEPLRLTEEVPYAKMFRVALMF